MVRSGWVVLLFILLLSNVSYAVSFTDPADTANPSIGKQLPLGITAGKVDKILVDSQTEELDVLVKFRRPMKNLISSQSLKKQFIRDDVIHTTISKDSLAALSASKEVQKIYANRKYALLLEDSLPLFHSSLFQEHGYTGQGIRIAVLDTGIGSGLVVDLEKDFIGTNPADSNGHGTQVAGIVKAVAPEVVFYNGKVLDDRGEGTTASIIEGIYWAIDPDGNPATDDAADIISLSLGAPFAEPDVLIEEALKAAIDANLKAVVAAGNCGGSCLGFTGVTVPGNYEPVITVGAVDNNLQKASFSSGQDFGSYIKPDVVAPGVDITVQGVTKSGTSMSTPFVSGAVALLLEKEGDLSSAQIKFMLENNAVDLGVEGKDVDYGSGFVDLGVWFGEEDDSQDDNSSPPSDSIPEISNYNLIVTENDNRFAGEYVSKTVYKYEYDSHIYEYSEALFQNSTDLRKYLYAHLPLRTDVSYTQESNHDVISYDDSFIWFNINKVMSISPVSTDGYKLLIDHYLSKEESLVGDDYYTTSQQLKQLMLEEREYTPSGYDESIDTTALDFSTKEFPIENESGS